MFRSSRPERRAANIAEPAVTPLLPSSQTVSAFGLSSPRLDFACTRWLVIVAARGFIKSVSARLLEEESHGRSRPDMKWEACISQYDLYVRATGGADSIRLTSDGIRYYGYGKREPLPPEVISGVPVPPQIVWSPDSRRLLVTADRRAAASHRRTQFSVAPISSRLPSRPRGTMTTPATAPFWGERFQGFLTRDPKTGATNYNSQANRFLGISRGISS